MDEITDNVGGLSLQAKEWKPGQGFAPTPKNNNILSSSSSAFTSTSRQVSAGSVGSGGGGSTNNVSGLVGQSSWGGKPMICYTHDIYLQNIFHPLIYFFSFATNMMMYSIILQTHNTHKQNQQQQ